MLAEELTKRIHSEESYNAVLQVSEILFNRKASTEYLKGLSTEALETIAQEIPTFTIASNALNEGIEIITILTELTSIQSSKGEAKRSIQNNAISINKAKIDSEEFKIETSDLIQGKYMLLENGKKNKYMLIFE